MAAGLAEAVLSTLTKAERPHFGQNVGAGEVGAVSDGMQRVAIVGGGFSGAMLATRLAERARLQPD